MDEIYMVLLARACGNGDLKPNVAEKPVWGILKTKRIVGFSIKNKNLHDAGREKYFWSLSSGIDAVFLARFSLW